ncbi:MAG: hypothetical protein ABI629_10450 [bacterium]
MHRRIGPWLVGFYVLGSVSGAWAQEVTPSVFPGSDLDFWAVFKLLLGSVNVPVLMMLSVLAAAIHSAAVQLGVEGKLSTAALLLAPPLGGAVVGALSAVAKAQEVSGGWIGSARLAQSVLEGAIVNGGMAVILGFIVSKAMVAAGIVTPKKEPLSQ